MQFQLGMSLIHTQFNRVKKKQREKINKILLIKNKSLLNKEKNNSKLKNIYSHDIEIKKLLPNMDGYSKSY